MLTLLLTALAHGPLLNQAALLPQANLALNDIRQVVRESSGDNGADPPPGMIYIPAGETIIGTDPDAVEFLGEKNQTKMTEIAAETPRSEQDVPAFYIDRTEVTNLQWKVYLDATGRKPSEIMVQYSWPGGEIPEGEELFPVTNVNHPEIEEFLSWAGKRLPTETEWTRAARGDDDRDYPWGPKWNSKVVQSGATIPQYPVAVGSHPQGASPYGALDMAGNVWEWVDSSFTPFDGFEPIEFKIGRKKIPLTPNFDSTRRVAKGGCYVSTREFIRVDSRLSLDPRDSDGGLGFRAARSILPGIEAVRHGYEALLPTRVPNFDDLDVSDVFAKEITSYDDSHGVITGHRFVAFAHPGPQRGSSLGRMRKDAKDEPVTLGLLVTSETLEEPPLPPGAYALAWKTKGESKAYKQKKKDARKNGEDGDAPAPVIITDPSVVPAGASAPWPGVRVHDVIEDLDFPQDDDVILFYNVNNAVVGWIPAPDVVEEEKSPVTYTEVTPNSAWNVEFSLDIVSRKVPRFQLPIKLAGDGIGG